MSSGRCPLFLVSCVEFERDWKVLGIMCRMVGAESGWVERGRGEKSGIAVEKRGGGHDDGGSGRVRSIFGG